MGVSVQIASAAIAGGRCLQLQYSGYTRLVEVHAVGRGTAGHDLMRVWQVSGGAVSGERVGFKLMKLDDAMFGELTDTPSAAPRSGYKTNDSAMTTIYCQL